MSEAVNARVTAPGRGAFLSWPLIARSAAMALAGAWAGYFLFTGMPQLTLEVFPRTVVAHALVGALAVVYVASLALARRLPGGTPIDAGVIALLGAYWLATLDSVSWRVSVEASLQLTGAVVVFYALADAPLLSATQLRRAFVLTTAALSVYALWVVGNDYADYLSLTREVEGSLNAGNIFPPTVPRVHDVSDHPNVLAMVLVLAMPFLLITAWRPEAWWERPLGIAALLAALMAIFLTLSRGGWLGAGAALALTLAGGWVTLRSPAADDSDRTPWWERVVPSGLTPTAVAAIGGALLLVAGGTLAFLERSDTRPGWLFRGSLSPREDAWESGLDMWGDHLLTGAGPNTFGLLYPEYSGEFLVHTQHAHNGFLQVADDAGLLGVLALAVLAVSVAYILVVAWRDGTIEQRMLAVACAAAFAGFSLHNQLDAGNIWKAPGIALAFVGAVAVRAYRERAFARPAGVRLDPRLRRYGGAALGVAAAAIAIVPLLLWVRIDRAHEHYWRGMERWAEGRAAEGIDELQRAVNSDSRLMIYQMQLGLMQATAYDALDEKDEGLIDRAIVHLQEAVELDPRSDLAHANLARAYQLAGRDDDAAAEAAKTRFIATRHVPPVLVAGEVYERLRREQEAVETYGQAISMDAGIADSAFWQDSDFRREHFDEIVGRSALGINPCTYGSYLVQAHRTDARAPLDELAAASEGCQATVFLIPDDLVLRVAYARILMEEGRMDDAFAHLDHAVRRQPDFGPARTELGRWHAARGDVDEARHQWVVGGELDQAESLLLLGESYGDDAVPHEVIDRMRELLRTTGSSVQIDLISILYYRMRYGRISPVFALIPGDWLQAVPRQYGQMQEALARWEPDQEAGRESREAGAAD